MCHKIRKSPSSFVILTVNKEYFPTQQESFDLYNGKMLCFVCVPTEFFSNIYIRVGFKVLSNNIRDINTSTLYLALNVLLEKKFLEF